MSVVEKLLKALEESGKTVDKAITNIKKRPVNANDFYDAKELNSLYVALCLERSRIANIIGLQYLNKLRDCITTVNEGEKHGLLGSEYYSLLSIRNEMKTMIPKIRALLKAFNPLMLESAPKTPLTVVKATPVPDTVVLEKSVRSYEERMRMIREGRLLREEFQRIQDLQDFQVLLHPDGMGDE